MVLAVQPPLAECTAIFTVCIIEHRPPPYAVIIHQPAQIHSGPDSKTMPASKTKGQCTGNIPNTLI